MCIPKKTNHTIKVVKNDRGECAREHESICSLFQSFYQDLFQSSHPKGIEEALQDMEPMVTLEMNKNFLVECTFEEVKSAVFEMQPLSSPCPDGFSVGFYQDNWTIVGDKVFSAVKDFFSTRSGIGEVNDTYIVLIPKKKCPDLVIEYRMRSKKEGYMALKLDMSKAYDKIEWPFLEAALRKMGFAEAWTKLIMECAEEKGLVTGFPFARGSLLQEHQCIQKETILTAAQVKEAKAFEKYLGLPSYVGRHKLAAFRPILDSIRNRIQNWKVKFISQVGKEVLLKSIVQAIPTYCMSIFKLPKVILKTINKLMQHFWWGSREDKVKTQWIPWKKLGQTKSVRGLGYRDFNHFNIALLAKQGWRLIQQPHSLAARVLKAKYFSRTDFMSGKLGSNASYLWKSFMEAKQVLEEGLFWRIGNGDSIYIGRDKWIHQPTSYRVQSPLSDRHSRWQVSELIDKQEKTWIRSILREVFLEREATVISKIPISLSRSPDQLI
ncbi:uncharacterized protein LOC122289271 [Carya illinoinensis]|uniref:uncharacterized protein LOC122289271 n=1 Tax=Carya illinoinensis TaxID=32201 RepID=UPI001C72193C|nr:uncharacterized protein LOC122289271 [Carya illinoinensis]